MRLRPNLPAIATTAPGRAAAEIRNGDPDLATAPTQQAPAGAPAGVQRRGRLIACCFGFEPESKPRNTAKLAAAVDRWAAEHGGQHAASACELIKRRLRDKKGDPRQELQLNRLELRHVPAEMGQTESLQTLDLSHNLLISFPAEMGQAKALETLDLSRNLLISFPAEMGQAKALSKLDLHCNRLTSFPAEMGQSTSLRELNLSFNQLTSFPAEMGLALAMHTLRLIGNRLDNLPPQIAQLPNLRYLDLSRNNFTAVPRSLLDAPATAEIDLRDNPLPAGEILAVREAMAQRRAAGRPVPMLLLPNVPEAPGVRAVAGELREAVANEMNVHTGVLTSAFKKRLDNLAKQFPGHLVGSQQEQHAQLITIETRLTDALTAHARQHSPDAASLSQARSISKLMFKKGKGETAAYYNEFDRSAGHVLAYTFLALEAQWARTPQAHRAEARFNGMAALIRALQSGSGMCDTRLCEEVMQIIGLPLTEYAQAHPEVVDIQPAQISIAESREIVMAAAKQVLQALLDADPALTSDAPPAAWRSTLAAKLQKDHPKLPTEHVDRQVQQIESAWESFHDMVVEQRMGEAR